MKGIHIHLYGGTASGEFLEIEIAGQDRKKTLEAAAARLPESVRADLRRQLGRCIEHENEQVSACVAGVDGATCIGSASPCEVIS